ncbi:MAG TPA: hypothetical protein VI603_17350 [Saprospiraceae bacterium]|nr:hypothetical protein [Saprospiraceae bacterium]
MSKVLVAQIDTDPFADIIEQVIQDLEREGDFDYDATYERLTGYLDHPADLNEDDLGDFVSMGLLSDGHLFALRSHIQAVGPLISIYELQSVPGFDIELIRRIRPFVGVDGDLWDLRQPLKSILFHGDHQLAMRWSRTLQEQHGFTPDAEGAPRYLGDPNRVYLRYRHRNENRLSYGITMEKDPGEEFFSGSNTHGFDFYSAHFFLHNYRRWMPRLAIGDFNINLGQGIIMHSGYGVGKSAFVTQIKKGGYAIRPFASVNEYDFLRGAAITINPGSRTQLTVFASSRKRDANVQIDTFDTGGEPFIEQSFTSLQLSGLHRTVSEIADEKQITHQVAGASVQYRSNGLRGGLHAVYHHLSSPLQRAEELYNIYRFQGTSLLNMSIDYTYLYRNIHFFGETAMSDNGALASVNGLLIGVHRRADIALLGRWLPRDYHHLGATPFAETSSGENEHGLYFGLEVRPTIQWTLSAYADIWRHPWLRFNVDAPSVGQEQLVRLTYRKKRSFEFYAQYRHELKEKNLTGNDEHFDPLVEQRKHQVRVHFAYKVTPSLELRSRIEGIFFREHTLPEETGFVLFQDVLFKPIGSDFSFTTRLALFDTDSFNSAIYAYENDLVNQFYIPAYAYRGVRYYLNLRYRGVRHVSLELRLAQTRYTDRDEIGSGNDLIMGNIRTDMKAQVLWEF